MAIIAVVVLLTYVIPTFQRCSKRRRSAPTPTLFVVWLSASLKTYWMYIIGVVVGIVLPVRQTYRTSAGAWR